MRLFFFRRQIVPEGFEEGIAGVCLQENGDDDDVSFLVAVYEVGEHVEPLAVDVFFAGMMKVKLLELVALAADVEDAAGRVVDLDGVAVVGDGKRGRLVVEFKLWQVGYDGAVGVNIDG